MLNPLPGVNTPLNQSIKLDSNSNQNQCINHLQNQITTAGEKARKHSLSMSNSMQSPREHAVKKLETPIINVENVDKTTVQSITSKYVKGLEEKKENLIQNKPAEQTLTRIITLLNSILKTGDLSSGHIYDEITTASQNDGEPPIYHHQDNKFGASYPKSCQIKNVHGDGSWPEGTVPVDCKKLESGETLTNPSNPKEVILHDSTIHWPLDMNDAKFEEKYLPQLSREIGNFSGPITIRRLLPGEVLMRDIGTGQSVKGSYWTKGDGKDFVHDGKSLHQNLAVKPEWNGGSTLAIFIVPNEGEFYVAEGKIASQEIKTADGNYELKGGGTQLSILTPKDEKFSGNEEIFNKCVAVIPNTRIDLTDDIPEKTKFKNLFD